MDPIYVAQMGSSGRFWPGETSEFVKGGVFHLPNNCQLVKNNFLISYLV